MECPPGKLTGISTSCFSSRSSKQWTKVSSRSKTTVIFPRVTSKNTFIVRVLLHIDRLIFSIIACIVVFFKKLKEKDGVKEMISNSWLFVLILVKSLGNIILTFPWPLSIICVERLDSNSSLIFHMCNHLLDHHRIFLITLTSIMMFICCWILLFLFFMIFLLMWLRLLSFIMCTLGITIFYFDCFFYGRIILRSTHFLE